MARTICCIGCGVMGGAIMMGLAKKVEHGEYNLCGFNRSSGKMEKLAQMGVRVLACANDAAACADILILGVKPYQIRQVLGACASSIRPDTLVVSLAAGVSLEDLRVASEDNGELCRCMPTTTAVAGEGIFAFCFEDKVDERKRDELLRLFSLLGLCVNIEEKMMGAFSALIGAGPAYACQVFQALTQAGVTLGFPHAQARELVCALFKGAAVMALQSDKALIQMRDEVCSPAGLTIAGVNLLERTGFSGILIDAVLAAKSRSDEMEK